MNALVEDWIQALRKELREYGEMLARLEEPGDTRRPAGAGEAPDASALMEQVKVIEQAWWGRKVLQQQLAHWLGLPREAALGDLILCLPSKYQPLAQALTDENRELPQRIQQCVAQDETSQQVLSSSLAPMS